MEEEKSEEDFEDEKRSRKVRSNGDKRNSKKLDKSRANKIKDIFD
jgi:hypothetical protein